jgi:hypothetical protein
VSIVALATLTLFNPRSVRAQVAAAESPSSSTEVRVLRVRSEDPTVTALITQATERSSAFRGFVDSIGQTDGIVYVARGRCRYGVGACLSMNVTVAGPSRLLRITIDPRRADCDLELMASIGHELWHAIEILREPSLRSHAAVFQFFSRGRYGERSGSSPAWETRAAVDAGNAVLAELRHMSSKTQIEMCGH